MSKAKRQSSGSNKPPNGWWVGASIALVIAVAVVASLNSGEKSGSSKQTDQTFSTITASSNPGPPIVAGAPPAPAATTTNVDAAGGMESAQSVVVTHDLDFGPARPTLAEAVAQIDRRSQPDDGQGRTFAILEAFNGEFQPDGRMRVSLRISTEKPGLAHVLFRPSNQELWKSRIKPAAHKPAHAPGNLTVLFDNGDGKTFTVDGSTGPATIFDAMLKEPGLPVAQAWPDGEERELSFVYSSCGCPIKVVCRRVGARTERTKTASQVIFPDDPLALQLISRLMVW